MKSSTNTSCSHRWLIGLSLLLLTVMLPSHAAKAQDIITKMDSTQIQAKVLEIGTDQVKYTLYGADSTVLVLPKSHIASINYQNGNKEVFQQVAPTKAIPKRHKTTYTFGNPINPVGSKKNLVGVGIASFFLPGLGHFICGDTWGGVLFLGGHIVCCVSVGVTASLAAVGLVDGTAPILSAVFLVGLDVLSIVTSVLTARDVNIVRGYYVTKNASLQLSPALMTQNANMMRGSLDNLAYGMSLRLNI